ncbi:MAG: SgcJ/EcaC family oxidoreductase [Mesorhizobium sp.]|uniref:YybH family protein n=1 Tax=Mesorhizobium sp. TaxID=1871066 RepID=UPI00121F02B1|nr:SgcJ/EcaC family oxidoreductase [Mesorhizobium sp.]TIP71135.1 MAG: SgcJ/EcaC family oxidoreductase [Mesorhizobium sp.]TIQ08829.1 MAG: SgcJ/EcaC family oxidoreductase [Mesorhizobium sp.]TIR48971.1 MAG: SgcJ/EcaC family oxidoreductase [Mesorhizobium sp.]TJV95583.1 MAG: SgcJ/EcaC family oxidoreductase [Mesorhizobium sp.]
MAQPTENIRDVLQKANDGWNSAFNSGNADAVAALYTPDAVVLPSTHSFVRGTGAIKDFWKELISAGVGNHGIELVDAVAAGDIAYATGKWSAEGGETQRYEGSIVTIFRRETDGSWRVCLHTWN